MKTLSVYLHVVLCKAEEESALHYMYCILFFSVHCPSTSSTTKIWVRFMHICSGLALAEKFVGGILLNIGANKRTIILVWSQSQCGPLVKKKVVQLIIRWMKFAFIWN